MDVIKKGQKARRERRVRLKPLEDLLSAVPTPKAYRELHRELTPYVNTPAEAKLLAWHLLIPKKIFRDNIERKTSLFPQADTLSCLYCSDELSLPMKYPRFHEVTQLAYRSVYYKPQGPQVCRCGNLNTLTDRKGNLRVYLQDGNESSFNLTYGPIQLLDASQLVSGTYDVSILIDAKRPKADDPFSYEVRNDTIVNHVNLLKASPIVAQMVVPYDLPSYARTYNLVIYTKKFIIFPTGHSVPTRKLRVLRKNAKVFLKETFGIHLNNKYQNLNQWFECPVVTPALAKQRNQLTSYLFHEVLEKYLEEHQRSFAEKLRGRLTTSCCSLPSFSLPAYQPTLFRVMYKRPLSTYKELTVANLPMFSVNELARRLNQQDFKAYDAISKAVTNKYYIVPLSKLKALLKERTKVLSFALPRLSSAHPSDIVKYAHTAFRHPTPHPTPFNEPLTYLHQYPYSLP